MEGRVEEERTEGREEGNGGRKPWLLEIERKVESSVLGLCTISTRA